MEVIPVMDLRAGRVVRACGGDRSRYRPLRSPLCADADPHTLLASLTALHPFRRVYVADLDAITGGGDNAELIVQLAVRYPAVELWVDAGARAPPSPAVGHLRAVYGSETAAAVDAFAALGPGERAGAVVSLDYRHGTLLGARLLERLEAEPGPQPAVIVMDLDRVGSGAGPRLRRLRAMRARLPRAPLYAAGGVRGIGDLQALAEVGVVGVLVASALHDGSLREFEIHAS